MDNYIGGYANVGEWSLLPSESNYGPSWGVAGGVGFLYEMQAGPTYSSTRFLLDVGVGAQGGMTAFKQKKTSYVELLNQKDLDGMTFDYMYEVMNRKDQYNDLAVQIPLMIGVQHKKFYMMAGVKAGMHVLTKAHTTATINTYGRYSEFAEFRNMPEYQFFNDYALKGTSNAKLNFSLDLSAEIGGRLGLVTDAVGFDVPKRKIEYRLAGFFDYGLLDIHTAPQPGTLVQDFTTPSVYNAIEAYNKKTMVNDLKVNDIMSTTGFASKVNNLVVGLKFTILFQLPEKLPCTICRDAYGLRPIPRSGRLKYDE